MPSRSRRNQIWGTRFGFYLAAVGSAFGLGNLWRFPYITVENGGGAFVLLYVIFALILGLPLLIGELMLGKLSRRSVVSACARVTAKSSSSSVEMSSLTSRIRSSLPWVGRVAALCCFLIFAYYAVISGWVLHFLMQLFVGQVTGNHFSLDQALLILRDHGGLQIALTGVHLLISLVIVAKGLQEGMEKWVSFIMPVFVVLLVLLISKSLSLPSATAAIRYLFYPDFTKLTSVSPLHAIGHVFFTLSIGFGTMVTFGSYLNEKTKIPEAGFRVTTMDTVLSLFAGLLIFPVLIGANGSTSGPELLFQTLPRLFLELDSGFVFGIAFFICLYLAALGASIGLLESLVANVIDLTSLSRAKATWMTGSAVFLVAILPALSTSTLRSIQYQGHGLLEIFDSALINFLIPLTALGISYLTATCLKATDVESEFVNDDSIATRKLYSHWVFVMKWLAPSLIVSAFAMAFWGWLS